MKYTKLVRQKYDDDHGQTEINNNYDDEIDEEKPTKTR